MPSTPRKTPFHKLKNPYNDEGSILCNHGDAANIFMSKTAKNPDREFYKCSLEPERACKFFLWADEAPPFNSSSKQHLDSPTPSTRAAALVQPFSTSAPASSSTPTKAFQRPLRPSASNALPTPPKSSARRLTVAAAPRHTRAYSPEWPDEIEEHSQEKLFLDEEDAIDEEWDVEAAGEGDSVEVEGVLSHEEEEETGYLGEMKRGQGGKFSFWSRIGGQADAESGGRKKRGSESVESDGRGGKRARGEKNPFTTTTITPPTPHTTPTKNPNLTTPSSSPATKEARLLLAAQKSLDVKKARIVDLEARLVEMEERVGSLEAERTNWAREKEVWARERGVLRRKLSLMEMLASE